MTSLDLFPQPYYFWSYDTHMHQKKKKRKENLIRAFDLMFRLFPNRNNIYLRLGQYTNQESWTLVIRLIWKMIEVVKFIDMAKLQEEWCS